MYFCPTNPEHERFTREAVQAVRLTIEPDGTTIAKDYGATSDPSPVRCDHCDARAEWRDARQEELFALAPAMF